MPNEVLSTAQLKELVRTVVVAQGNTFIKELLRSTASKIGSTKQEFAQNLDDAIDEGRLTQGGLETWLQEVEGWGNQHVYLLTPPRISAAALARGIANSDAARLQDAAASLEFPVELALTQIRIDDHGLSVVWHQGKESWSRATGHDFRREEGFELYRYEAHRQRVDRSVVRFEWRFDNDYCSVLIQRNTDLDHSAVFEAVQGALGQFGCHDLPLRPISLVPAIRSAAQRVNGVHPTRFEHTDGYVELASRLSAMGIEAVAPVRAVLQAVDPEQFGGAQAMLSFAPQEHDISREIHVQVSGGEGKVRILMQCKREDVLAILQVIWGYNVP